MGNKYDRLDLMNEQDNEPYKYAPEGKACGTNQKVPNKGEIVFPEKHPADPLKDDLAREMSHRGGLASSRTEFY